MKAYNAKDIRNIALAGHGGRGKTSLAEAMLYLAKATDRLGRVADGNTVLDYDAEEKRRVASVSTAVAPIEWKNTKVNIIDTPGMFDFAGGVAEGIRAAECALIVVGGSMEKFDVGAEKAIKAADKRGIAKMFAVTRLDSEQNDFYRTFNTIVAQVGASACPIVVPQIEDGKVTLLSAIPLPDPVYEKQRTRIPYNPIAEHDYSVDEPSFREISPGHFVHCNDAEEEKYKKMIK